LPGISALAIPLQNEQVQFTAATLKGESPVQNQLSLDFGDLANRRICGCDAPQQVSWHRVL
jgi:hypothetical protein